MEVSADGDDNNNNSNSNICGVGGTTNSTGETAGVGGPSDSSPAAAVATAQDVDAKKIDGSTTSATTTRMIAKEDSSSSSPSSSPLLSPSPPPPPPAIPQDSDNNTITNNGNKGQDLNHKNNSHHQYQNQNQDEPLSPPNVTRSLIPEPEKEANGQEEREQEPQQQIHHGQPSLDNNLNKEQQLEDRVQELEEKLATLSRLLLMQQRQAAATASNGTPAAAGGGGGRRAGRGHHRDASSSDVEDEYADEEEYYYNDGGGSSSIHHNLSSTILSVTPPGSPSPYGYMSSYHHNDYNHSYQYRRGSNGRNRRIDGSMHVALESPAPSRRPTMELIHSPMSDEYNNNSSNNNDHYGIEELEQDEDPVELRYDSTQGGSGGNSNNHYRYPIPRRISQHQRNLSYRVFNTNEFAAPEPSPPPIDDDEEIIRDEGDSKGEDFALAVGTGTPVVTEGEEAGRNDDEKGTLIGSNQADQNLKTENDLANEMHSRIDVDLINHLNSALQTKKEVAKDPSEEDNATSQSSKKKSQSEPGIFLPNVLTEGDNNLMQPQTESDTSPTHLTTNNVMLSDSSPIVNKAEHALPQSSAHLLKRTNASSKSAGTDESPSTFKKVVKDTNEGVSMIGELPKKARSSVASTLTLTSETTAPAASATDNATPSSQKTATLKRERSLSVTSAQSSSTRVTSRSDNQGGHPSSSSSSNNNASIKSKWLDYLNSVQESNYDTDKQMEEFVKVPSAVEGLLSYGFWICVDSFLYSLTILPIRFVWSCLLLIRFVVLRIWQSSVPEGPFRFNRRHFYQLIQVSIIYGVYAMVLKPIDISILYHWIRVQNMVKLYLLIAIVEVFDRLMCSLGQDCLDSLYWNTTRRPRSFRHLVSVVVVLTYTALHSILLFVHVATMNVAMNSSDQALLSLLIGGNFAEIKSTVFKKYNKASLFKITASDVCERFKLGLFLVLVLSLNFSQGMEKKMLIQYFHMCGIVWCAEWLSDWIKHSFITKFNYITSGVYSEYGLLLAGDVTGMGHEGLNLDSSHSVVRRLGLAQIPLVVVMCKYLREAYKYATYENSLPSWAVWLGFSAAWSALLVCKLSLGKFLHKISMQKLEAAPAFSKSQSTVAKKKV